jgi:hypothetical protein
LLLFLCIVVNVICSISRFQDGGSFQLNPLVTTGRLRILRRMVINQIRRYKQIALELRITLMLFRALTRVHLCIMRNQVLICVVFTSPDPKDHLSYCHHFASVVVAVVCCHLLDQMIFFLLEWFCVGPH